MHRAYRVTKPYQTGVAVPLTACKGERLRFERRKTEWAGWVWCTDAAGRCGWVPENWLELQGEQCVLRRDYTAAELSVDKGEIITAHLVESGWLWATNESGGVGWVPLEHLAPAAETDAPYRLSDAEQAQMLRKLILYWDGQWFLKTTEAIGLDAAIALNARVRASFGRIEMRLLLKALGKSQADDLADALHLLETYAEAFLAKGIRAEFASLGSDRAEVIVRRCAAYEGARQAALARADQACVACETLWQVWLETLLPGIQAEVEYPMRQGKGDPICRFVLHVSAGSMGI